MVANTSMNSGIFTGSEKMTRDFHSGFVRSQRLWTGGTLFASVL